MAIGTEGIKVPGAKVKKLWAGRKFKYHFTSFHLTSPRLPLLGEEHNPFLPKSFSKKGF